MQKGLRDEVKEILPDNILSRIENIDSITELRLRKGKRLNIQVAGVDRLLQYIVSEADIDTVVARASCRSLYACQDNLVRGYLPSVGGVRIGICGEGVSEGGKTVAMKNIRSLVIRIPHEAKGCADSLGKLMKDFQSTLIVSPPSAGKTTLLREIIRNLANDGKNVLLLDERGEVSAYNAGMPQLDLGEQCDVVAYINKATAYESAVRSMNPHVIATDEIFGESEINAIVDIARSGIKILATVHGDNPEKVLDTALYSRLKGVFKYGITLSKSPKIGTIKEVKTLC